MGCLAGSHLSWGEPRVSRKSPGIRAKQKQKRGLSLKSGGARVSEPPVRAAQWGSGSPQGTTPPGSLPRRVFCKEHLLRSHQSHLATYCSQFPFSSRSNTRSSPLQGLQKQTDRKPTWGGVGLSAESGLLPAQSVRRCLPKWGDCQALTSPPAPDLLPALHGDSIHLTSTALCDRCPWGEMLATLLHFQNPDLV